jgi:hypothetical protein
MHEKNQKDGRPGDSQQQSNCRQLQVRETESSALVASFNIQLSRAQTEVASLWQQLNESEGRTCDLKIILNCPEVEERKLETSLGEIKNMQQKITELEHEDKLFIAKYAAKKGRWLQKSGTEKRNWTN